MSARQIRMKDIAVATGVSVMTVSLALRNSPRIGEETGRRIRREAARQGYRPDPFVSALVARRRRPLQTDAGVLAVLTKFEGPFLRIREEGTFYSDLWEGIERRGGELGFRIEEFPTCSGEGGVGRKLSRVLRTRGIRGVIFFPGGGLERSYPELEWEHFSMVGVAFHAPDLPIHRVASDHGGAIERALLHAEAGGARRIGLAMSSSLDPEIRHAMSGRYLAWQQGIPRARRLPFIVERAKQSWREAFEDWLDRARPDVVLSLHERESEWLRENAKTRGVGFVHLARRKSSMLAGVDLRSGDVGCAAVNVLVRELYLNHTGLPEVPEMTLVGGRWEEGGGIWIGA